MREVYLGIDWHKKTSTWVALDTDRNVWERQKVACVPEAVRAAYNEVAQLSPDIRDAIEPVFDWFACADSTGDCMSDQSLALGEPLFCLHRHFDGQVTNDLFELFVFFLEFVVFQKTDGTHGFCT